MGIKSFFKRAFSDMKADAKAHHQVDKANFNAARAESRAQWEEAKAMGKPETRKAMMQAQRDGEITEAKKRQNDAQARINAAKNNK